jgi:predicted nucleic acid-binding protein
MTLILDAGALIGIDRRDRRLGAVLRIAQQQRIPVRTSAAALAQVWRGARQANLARILTGVDTLPLDEPAGRRIGELLARARTKDVVDGHIALLADTGDTVLTSDVPDIRSLITSRKIQASVIPA